MISTRPIQSPSLAPQEGVLKDLKSPGKGGGPSFGDVLGGLSEAKSSSNSSGQTNALQGVQKSSVDEAIKFSNHAIERMSARGIKFSQDDLGKLNQAVQKAASKGSKDSLVLLNDTALIVSVKNKTVVTVMDKNALKENVFTNIDSTIVM